MQAIVLKEVGSPSKLKAVKLADPKIRKNDILIKHTTIGVNFSDICFRNGTYKMRKLPAIIGMEGCGVIEKIGSGVKNFKVGERVAYATGALGSYREKRAVNQDFVLPVPDSVSDEQAAACLHKGLLVHTLLHRTYLAARSKRILVQSAAGGVGHLLCQWARRLKLEVIGTVGSPEKVDFASHFCDMVIDRSTENIVDKVAKFKDGTGVGAAYDSVGKDTLEKSIKCIWPMGICINYGESSGKPNPLDLKYLDIKSTYLTKPSMALYKANPTELRLAGAEVFAAIEQKILKPKITSFAFKDAAKAHQLIESKKSIGSIILKV